jgi:hypothetical protein
LTKASLLELANVNHDLDDRSECWLLSHSWHVFFSAFTSISQPLKPQYKYDRTLFLKNEKVNICFKSSTKSQPSSLHAFFFAIMKWISFLMASPRWKYRHRLNNFEQETMHWQSCCG